MKTKPDDDELLSRRLRHLRARHGMEIVDCDACGGAGCSLCELSGVGGIGFPDPEKRPPCGPKCPVVNLLKALLRADSSGLLN